MQANIFVLSLVLGGLSLAACGDDSEPSPECEAAKASCDGSGQQSVTLLGTGATTYEEAQEVSNGSTAELTQYTLESEQGLAIEGSFEGASPTADKFLFNSGALGSAKAPGFPGVDIQVVVDGKALDTADGAFLSLDTVKDFGYSSLSGSYFMNAALISGQDYVLSVTPAASLRGKDYTIEIRGHITKM